MAELMKSWPCNECPDLLHFTPGGVGGGPPLDPPYTECALPTEDCAEHRAVGELAALVDATAYALRTLSFKTLDAHYRTQFAEYLAAAFSDMAMDLSAELDADEFLRRAIPLMERPLEAKT